MIPGLLGNQVNLEDGNVPHPFLECQAAPSRSPSRLGIGEFCPAFLAISRRNPWVCIPGTEVRLVYEMYALTRRSVAES